jgi:uncharacterized membrane protein
MYALVSCWLSSGKLPFRSTISAALSFSLAILLVSQILLLSADAQIKYTVTRLVPLTNVSSNATAISLSGDVVGDYYWRSAPTISRPFLYHAGIAHDLGVFTGASPGTDPANISTHATAINIENRIAGYATIDVTDYAFTYYRGKYYPIGTGGKALGINIGNTIVGGDGAGSGWFWDKQVGTQAVGFVSLFFVGKPSLTAINFAMVATGYGVTSIPNLTGGGNQVHVCREPYLPFGTVDRGTLGGDRAYGLGINANAEVVGASLTNGNAAMHAFIDSGRRYGGLPSQAAGILNYGPDMQDIHTLNPVFSSVATGDNFPPPAGLAQVVGYYSPRFLGDITLDSLSDDRAFLYDGGKMVDLNTLIDPSSGWVLQRAAAINDAGQIVGSGFFNGETYLEAFLLTPL